MFVYTGKCSVHNDGNDNWRIKFLTSGSLTSSISIKADVFVVGGGGGGANGLLHNGGGGGGGGTGEHNGGYTAGASGGSGIVVIRNVR